MSRERRHSAFGGMTIRSLLSFSRSILDFLQYDIGRTMRNFPSSWHHGGVEKMPWVRSFCRDGVSFLSIYIIQRRGLSRSCVLINPFGDMIKLCSCEGL